MTVKHSLQVYSRLDFVILQQVRIQPNGNARQLLIIVYLPLEQPLLTSSKVTNSFPQVKRVKVNLAGSGPKIFYPWRGEWNGTVTVAINP